MQRAPSGAIGALAASAAAAVAATFRPSRREQRATSTEKPPPPPPPYEPPDRPPPPYSVQRPADPGGAPPAYAAVQENGFDPRQLTDFQLDELVHRLIGRITRLIRAELRTDRERIGRLRDPRF